jgi:hypothetical protein
MLTSRPGASFFVSPLLRNRPFLRFIEGAGDGGAGGGDQNGGDTGFPANTPVKDMNAEQQAAYWKHQSRQHENRWKAYGDDMTPDKARQLITENNDLKSKGLTDAEKAIAEAEERGRATVRTELEAERVTYALDKALSGRIVDPMALLTLDRRQFAKDGRADTDAIKAWVEQNSTAGTGTPRRAPDLGQGHRGTDTAPEKGAQAGRDLFTSRKKTPTAS